ncbi:MAG: hypothetical protein MJA83_06575 [Gammaproteobacteria bacterium]|nr:hypothetical protein [Gammaproteobacteria bacterium]
MATSSCHASDGEQISERKRGVQNEEVTFVPKSLQQLDKRHEEDQVATKIDRKSARNRQVFGFEKI